MADTIEIIKLDPHRWEEYKNIRLRSLKNAPLAFGASFEEDKVQPEPHWRGRLEARQNDGGSFLLFAEQAGKLVGMMGVFRPPRQKMSHVAHIYAVYVDEAVRGQGVGSRLLEAVIDEVRCRYPDVIKIGLAVNPVQTSAVVLYQKAGFEYVGTLKKELCVDEQYYDEHLMELML